MRHKRLVKKFGKNISYRNSIFCNLSKSLIKYGYVKTTLVKAKELRRFIEPLITISKKDNISNRRRVLKKINDKNLVNKLFFVIGKRFYSRNGGYLRIFKYKYRKGDSSLLAFVKMIEN